MKIWIVNQVKRGFIEEPEIFYSGSGAEKRKQELLNDFNPDYDEIEVFEKRIRGDGARTPLR
jgi:hypothetical protein